MAERRMFAKTIVLSDAFLDMPLSARCLYFTLGIEARDKGVLNNARSIARFTGCGESALQELISRGYITLCDECHKRLHKEARECQRLNGSK